MASAKQIPSVVVAKVDNTSVKMIPAIDDRTPMYVELTPSTISVMRTIADQDRFIMCLPAVAVHSRASACGRVVHVCVRVVQLQLSTDRSFRS